jgi:hypothetical protein
MLASISVLALLLPLIKPPVIKPPVVSFAVLRWVSPTPQNFDFDLVPAPSLVRPGNSFHTADGKVVDGKTFEPPSFRSVNGDAVITVGQGGESAHGIAEPLQIFAGLLTLLPIIALISGVE